MLLQSYTLAHLARPKASRIEIHCVVRLAHTARSANLRIEGIGYDIEISHVL